MRILTAANDCGEQGNFSFHDVIERSMGNARRFGYDVQIYDLGGLGDGRAFELVTTTEPCAMCLGAIPWSGLSSVVCGARDQDAVS